MMATAAAAARPMLRSMRSPADGALLVRDRQGTDIGVNFGSHKALLTASVTHQHDLSGTQLGQPVAAQRLHVHENVFGALAARKESESLGTVEPFDERPFETAFRNHHDMGALILHLGRMYGSGRVHRNDPEGLQAAFALPDETHDTGAFERRLETIAPEAGHVDQDIPRFCAVGEYETVPLGDIEPLYRSRHLDQPGSIAAVAVRRRLVCELVKPHKRGLFPHKNAPC